MIGNGFDLEHNLPTSYSDFLDFCKSIRCLYEPSAIMNKKMYHDEVLKEWKTDVHIKKILLAAFDKRYSDADAAKDVQYDTGIRTGIKEIDELYSYVKFNTWLEYFEDCRFKLGQNWIDFETEISRVIQALDAAKFQLSCGGSFTAIEEEQQKALMAILKAGKGSLQMAYGNKMAICKFANFLNKELGKLIRALEIYLSYFINNIPVTDASTDISMLDIDAVLSFNYTDTYARIYGLKKKVQYDHIHGKAETNKTVESCNIVLGIDEYLDDEQKSTDLDFLTFKKYYQRIYKSTGNKYLAWADEIKDDYEEYQRKKICALEGRYDGLGNFPWQKSAYIDVSRIEMKQHTVYIFGHSLDITDQDILKLFICNDNVQTKIYYHRKNEEDKSALGKIIKNLVKIMGPDELIRRTGGVHKTIEFIPQQLKKAL